MSADFDGDGDKEIVIGGTDGWLYVVTYNGASWSMAWSRQTAVDLNAAGAPSGCENTSISDIRSSVAVGDLDNNGRLEIVVATGGSPAYHRNGGVLVYTFNSASPWSFSAVSGWPQPNIDELGNDSDGVPPNDLRKPDGCWDGIEASPAIGDLDGDGDMEIVLEALNRRIYAWHHNGVAVNGWPIHRDSGDALLRGGLSSPALGDMDGDGLVEVVIGTNSPPWGGEGSPAPDYSKATVWAINGDSTNVPGWPVATENNIYSSPAIGDIDGDGQLEVVVGSGPSVEGGNGHWVYAWNTDGSPVSGWPQSTSGDVVAPPALGDLDGDGDLEVVIGCGIEFQATCTWLYAWHGNGAAVTGFPMSPGNFTLPYSPILVDYDGDGSVEILIVDQASFAVKMVENNGTLNASVSLSPPGFLYNPPLVDDLDNDGYLEAVVGGFGVYIWDTTTSASVAQPWPMFHHNPHRTGNFDFTLDTTPPQNPTTLASSTHVANTWSNNNTVQVSWSGASDDESGIAGYYYAWDTSATTSVDTGDSWLNATAIASPLSDGNSWYFHLRAINGANMLADGTLHLGPFKIDTTPPSASLVSLPGYTTTTSIPIRWSGNDAGSGIAAYDVQVQVDGGAWNDWQTDVSFTTADYPASANHTYCFRVRAQDQANNVGDYSSDTCTTVTSYMLSGQVLGNRDQPIFAAQIDADPPMSNTIAASDPAGEYELFFSAPAVYTFTVSRSGFGDLSSVRRSISGSDAGMDLVLPPQTDEIVNGDFEQGLSGWDTSVYSGDLAVGTLSVTPTAYAGTGALYFTRTAIATQTLALPPTMTDPTLSLLYRVGGTPQAGDALTMTLYSAASAVSKTLSLDATDWTHAWLGLDGFLSEHVTVTLECAFNTHPSESYVLVDQVSLGAAEAGVKQIYLPLVLRLH